MLAVRCCASGREQLHLLSWGEGPFFYALSAALAVQVQAGGCAGSTRPAPPVAPPAGLPFSAAEATLPTAAAAALPGASR